MDRDRLLRTFLELVAIDSPTGHEEAIGKDLEAVRRAGLRRDERRDRQPRRRAPGTRDGTILVSTHMDTAGTDRGIVPIIGDDGVIRTDGSTILGADDKSGIAGCLELLTLLREQPGRPHPTIEFVVTVGEERGLVGSRHMDVSRLKATHGFVFDTAGVMRRDHVLGATSVYLTITVHGQEGARGRRAGEGHQRHEGGRRGDRGHAARPDRRGDRREHRHDRRRRGPQHRPRQAS